MMKPSPPSRLTAWLEMDIAQDFDPILAQVFHALTQGSDAFAVPAPLKDAMLYSLLAPGKRIRPKLTLLIGQALGLQPTQVLPAALALEIFHCFTLIHDDLPCMDDDDWRRGQPSNHKQFGEALALLAGDSLLVMAAEVFFSPLLQQPHPTNALPVPPERLIRSFQCFCRAAGAAGVMGGQALELALTRPLTPSQLSLVHRKKTGLLFELCAQLPCELAEAQSADRRELQIFTESLGRAFQLIDDLEDHGASPGGAHALDVYTKPRAVAQAAKDELTQARLALSRFAPNAHPTSTTARHQTPNHQTPDDQALSLRSQAVLRLQALLEDFFHITEGYLTPTPPAGGPQS